MIALLLTVMVFFLLFNFPMVIPMVAAPLAVMIGYMPNMDLSMSIQQLIAGISAQVLLAVPMFILAADIMCAGNTTKRLLDLVETFVGHIHGGMAITTAITCTMFGAISGSTQATVVAIGKPMRQRLLKLGYSDSSSSGLIINSAIIALLIPPSISMIMYAVVTGSSVGDLFIAGIGPGILILIFFSIYSYLFAKITKMPCLKKATWSQRGSAFKRAVAPLGFPVIIFAGIYSGFFSPTEAAAVAVLYALVLEMCVFKTVKLKDLHKIALSTGVVTCAVFILVSGGQLFSWVISYAKIPQMLTTAILGTDPTALKILITVTIFFFIGCMFVDSLVVIIILSPIFYPLAIRAGINPIHLGIIITLQAAIGSVSPPFGCNIFTGCAIFNRPYLDIVKGIPPYLIMLILITIVVITCPQLSLFLL
ncbi:MAG: TRAP transporter large permease [Lachnospiraceae bacterium]|nr:TRAP transporter large permease [Lachnospiraceae bacterium]